MTKQVMSYLDASAPELKRQRDMLLKVARLALDELAGSSNWDLRVELHKAIAECEDKL